MVIEINSNQIDIQELSNKYYVVTYYPCNRFALKKRFVTFFEPGSKYYQMVKKISDDNSNWVELCYLAMFVMKYDNEIIPAI